MSFHSPLVLFALASSTGGLLAQAWRLETPPTSPNARYGHAMVTDLAGSRVVLFGGMAGSAYLGDTWEFAGATWQQVPAAGPRARSLHAMAFDAARGRAVLFGGSSGIGFNDYLSDTWEYDNGVWQQRATGAATPPPRFGHAMAYDRTRNRVVMFGGRTRSGIIFLDDTWEWDGTSWTSYLPATRPGRRVNPALAFDPVSGRVLLFGGLLLGGPFAADTWTWDGTSWTQLAPVHAPSPRARAVLATDLAAGRVVLYGGSDGTELDETWSWNGSDWTPHGDVQPGVPALPALAMAPSGRHVILFGGADAGGTTGNRTWQFGDLAIARAFGAGCGAPSLTLGASDASVPAPGQTFRSECAPVPSGGSAVQFLGASNTAMGSLPLPIDLTFLGMTGCWLYHDMIAAAGPATMVGNAAVHSLPVPNQVFLIGARLFQQEFVLAPGSNPLGILSSNGLQLTIGHP
jgi:hypothetical protein